MEDANEIMYDQCVLMQYSSFPDFFHLSHLTFGDTLSSQRMRTVNMRTVYRNMRTVKVWLYLLKSKMIFPSQVFVLLNTNNTITALCLNGNSSMKSLQHMYVEDSKNDKTVSSNEINYIFVQCQRSLIEIWKFGKNDNDIKFIRYNQIVFTLQKY